MEPRTTFLRLAAVLGLAACGHSAAAAPPSVAWGSPVEVASGGGHRGEWRQNASDFDFVDDGTVALDEAGNALVAWVDHRHKDVFFQSYDPDGNARLTQPTNVSRTPAVFSWLPRIALSPAHSGDVYLLWQEIVFSGGSHGGEIFFARSTDKGARFTAPLNLSASAPGDGKGRINRQVWDNGSLDIAVAPEGIVYAAWTEYDGNLWFTRSTDRGMSFAKPALVASTAAPGPARAPALAAARDDIVYLAWTVGEDRAADIRVARSMDGGRTFGPPAIPARTPGYSDAPKLAVDADGALHLVHAEGDEGPFGRYHVRYLRSTDGGATFTTGRVVSGPRGADTASRSFPALGIDARGAVYVLWEVAARARERPRGLAYAVSTDGGTVFSAPREVRESADRSGGYNGSQQGLLMRKLAVSGAGDIAVVNSSLARGRGSRVWLIRGRLEPASAARPGVP